MAKTSYVRDTTIRKNVPTTLNNPGETQICRVGSRRLLLTRGDRLDRYGNPVYTATLMHGNGQLGKSHRSNGSAHYAVTGALKKNGIDVKYQKPTKTAPKRKTVKARKKK